MSFKVSLFVFLAAGLPNLLNLWGRIDAAMKLDHTGSCLAACIQMLTWTLAAALPASNVTDSLVLHPSQPVDRYSNATATNAHN